MQQQKKFYTIQVYYKSDNELKMYRITNLDTSALKKLREDIFICGILVKIDTDTSEIISPWNITQTLVFRQAHFFSASADLSRGLKNDSSNYSPKK